MQPGQESSKSGILPFDEFLRSPFPCIPLFRASASTLRYADRICSLLPRQAGRLSNSAKTDGFLRRNDAVPRLRYRKRNVLSESALLYRCEVSTSPAEKVPHGRNRAAECTLHVCRNVPDRSCPGAWLRSRNLSRSATSRYTRSNPQRKVLFARVFRTDTPDTDRLE